MGRIYIVMGKSATGKDTIYKRLLEDENLVFETVVTYTTRPIRSGEKNGIEYFFVDENKFFTLKKQGKVMEYRSYDTVMGRWYYFTVDDGQVDLRKGNYLMITTLEGYQGMRSCFGKEAVVPIYIEVEPQLRLERAVNREKTQKNPNYAEVCRRFLADEEDFKEENLILLEIKKRYQNTDLLLCMEEIIADIQKEKIVV